MLGVSPLALGACDSLLEAELPHVLTEAAITGPSTAETAVNSAIALFECGYSAFGTTALGHEDVMESIAGAGQQHQYNQLPATGNCDTSSASLSFFDQIMGARALLTTDPALLVSSATGEANGVYDKIQSEYTLPAATEARLSAISAIYVAASVGHLGEFMCDMAFDGSEMISPTETLDVAEAWADRALGHITTDFAMPFGIAPSARNMALSIRSRIRWAQKDYAGAAADAATVLAAAPTFTAWVTRETGATRRNKIYHSSTAVGFSGGLGVNTWWNGSIRQPNPATGQQWPNPIPHTGYLFLGIMPDGRTLEAGNVPVRWANEKRGTGNAPVSLNNGAVADTRVTTIFKAIQGPEPREVPNRYTSEDQDIPYMTWQELRLIQADDMLAKNNLSGAIDQVNAIRAAANLPQISGAYRASLLASATATRHMLLEERRREFFAEGARYWSTKIQNPDALWFPRGEGQTPYQGYLYQGGVRLPMPADEYTGNPHFVEMGGLSIRGTGCDVAVRPRII